MGVFLAFPILIIAAVLQAVLLPHTGLIGGGPNLIFLLVLAWALNAPIEQAFFWAVIGGVATDLLSAAPLGTSALGLVLIVFVMNLFLGQFYELGLLLLVLMALFGTFAFEFYRMVALDAYQVLGYIPADAPFSITWGNDIANVIAPVMIYNVISILPVYGVLRLLQRRLPRVE